MQKESESEEDESESERKSVQFDNWDDWREEEDSREGETSW